MTAYNSSIQVYERNVYKIDYNNYQQLVGGRRYLYISGTVHNTALQHSLVTIEYTGIMLYYILVMNDTNSETVFT